MRFAAAPAILLVVALSGCTMPACDYQVRWTDPTLVDALAPGVSYDRIPLDAQGLPPQFAGAGVESVEWTGPDGASVVTRGERVRVETDEGADPAAAFDAVRGLMARFTNASQEDAEAVVAALEASHTTMPTASPSPDEVGPYFEWYDAPLDVTWRAADGLLDHYDVVPAERDLVVGDLLVRVVPRGGHGYTDATHGLYADAFGAVRYNVQRDPEDDNRAEVLLELARTTLARDNVTVPADARVVYVGGDCGDAEPGAYDYP